MSDQDALYTVTQAHLTDAIIAAAPWPINGPSTVPAITERIEVRVRAELQAHLHYWLPQFVAQLKEEMTNG